MSDIPGHDNDEIYRRSQRPRNLATLPYSGLVVAGLAVVTLAGVTGAAAAPRLGVKPLTHAVGHGTPAHSSRTASRRLARRLLSEVELPPGTTRLTFATLPRILRILGDGTLSDHKVDVFKVYWNHQSFEDAYAFVSKHHPAGWKLEGSGSSYKTVHGKKIYFYRQVTYIPRRLPTADDDIEMQISVVPHNGHSWIRADLMVIWYPRRSAAEELIASHIRSVTARVYRLNEKPRELHRTFQQQAIIDRLVKVLDSAKASPGSPFISCPAIDTTYTLTFHPSGHHAAVRISASGCYSLGIRVGPHWQPALVDNGRVEQIISHLFHIRRFLVPGSRPTPRTMPAR